MTKLSLLMEGTNLSLHNEIISTTKREALGVIATIKHFQPYLLHVVSYLPTKEERTSLQFPQLVKAVFRCETICEKGMSHTQFCAQLVSKRRCVASYRKKIARLTTPFDRHAVFSCR